MASGQLSKAKKGIGVKLSIDNGDSPLTYTQICDVNSITHEGATFDEVDITHLNSPEDDNGVIYKETMLGLKDPGSFTLELNYTLQDGQDKLLAAQGSRKYFYVDFPQFAGHPTYTNGLRLSFAALVGAIEPNPDVKGVIKASCKLRISGDVAKSNIPS